MKEENSGIPIEDVNPILARTKEEHISSCKTQALAVLENGTAHEAWSKMMSELEGHPETRYGKAIGDGLVMFFNGSSEDNEKVREWIKNAQ